MTPAGGAAEEDGWASGKVLFEGEAYPFKPGDSVLDCLLRQEVNIASSCHAGACQICILRMLSGEIPEPAQSALRPTQRERQLFLACRCAAAAELEVARIDDAG